MVEVMWNSETFGKSPQDHMMSQPYRKQSTDSDVTSCLSLHVHLSSFGSDVIIDSVVRHPRRPRVSCILA
jgi:hypothetical protein